MSFRQPLSVSMGLGRQEKPEEYDTIPDNLSLQEIADQVVRGKLRLSPQQVRVLIELLPFHMPKLSAVGVGYLDGTAFADRLERALRRSESARLINGSCERVEDEGR